MAKKERSSITNGKSHNPKDKPRSGAILSGGIVDSAGFASEYMRLAGDIIAGRVTPSQGNAATGAGRNVLKIAELTIKYGQMSKAGRKLLQLGEPQHG